MLKKGLVDKIILARPAVEAGERLGFLPGDMKEKIDPYLRPIYDALYEMMPSDRVEKKIESGEIEIAPLAFMRGRTFTNAFVIIDEAQNTTSVQMKMVLTRIGEGSRMVINGDLSQIDLPTGQKSGLKQAQELLNNIESIKIIELGVNDIIRHPIVAQIIKAYDKSQIINKF
jgi:phosphate starvation-inducible PhoH-like protein